MKLKVLKFILEDTIHCQLNEPSVEKIKLLPLVIKKLKNSIFGEQFLENQVLDVLRLWLLNLLIKRLEPQRHDRSLPTLDVQGTILGILNEVINLILASN